MTDQQTEGQIIKATRQRLGLNALALAEIAEVSPQWLRDTEKGRYRKSDAKSMNAVLLVLDDMVEQRRRLLQGLQSKKTYHEALVLIEAALTRALGHEGIRTSPEVRARVAIKVLGEFQ